MFFRRSVPRNMRLKDIAIDRIAPNPRQPRRAFNGPDIERLAASIRRMGLIRPLCVRKKDGGGYELISGERRLRAAYCAGLFKVPCLIVENAELMPAFWPVAESLQTEPLSVFEESEGIRRMIDDLRISQNAAAELLGITAGEVAERLRILKLNDVQRGRLSDAGVGLRHMSYIARIDTRLRDRVVDAVVSKKLSEADTERLASGRFEINKDGERPKRAGTLKDTRLFDNSLARLIDVMCASGVKAASTKREADGYTEYVIRVGNGAPAAASAPDEFASRQLPLF